MEFFFPADVFAAYPRQGPSARTTSFGAGPSSNVFSGCGFDSHPSFADALVDAIQHERAAHARAQAQRAARAEAARRAKAAAARRQAEERERQAQAYFQHILELQQREAQRRYHLEQLHRQRQEAQRRAQYEEYQRRKAYAIEKERQRIAAAKAAEDQSKHLFLALEDLIFGGLNGFYRACQQQQDDEDDDDEMDQAELAHKDDTYQAASAATAAPQTSAVDIKGKGKAQETDDTKPAMEVDDHDPEEVGPVPTSPTIAASPSPAPAPAPATPTKTEQVVFSHAFPADASFDKSTVRADQINVSVDEAQRKVTVSGLWNNEPTSSAAPARAASPAPSDSSSRRGRSRSPKRARVSDVDENGNEIDTPDADTNDDDFVEVNFTRAAPAPEKVEKTFDLPAGANIEDLRAELTDEGLKLFTSVSA
ncbi:uncharacterized protein SRS1_11417 [Sporisorium reilianum f. sp. reilianum]|uniref:Uncharacterized protein n=1 Tax=Sporisorium reilianum f. sp. reilianum TaxID=72559 RepID=A0A2N8U528_9BASI|nr:uncharacterized protein SRS1_11417 [Sporisorium reilianum f. sp. reilianum]